MPAAAQSEQTAPLDTYVRVVRGDSLELFYGPDYRMAQPACARFRRQTRLDSAGAFHGAFRDARWPSDSVLLTGRYQHGRKEGLFTFFHPNGQRKGEGRYQANRRVGEWRFWYASGQPAEVLHYDERAQLTVRQYWTAAGQQLVVNGSGSWRREMGTSGAEFSGPVVGGRPLGAWQLTHSPTSALRGLSISETYGPDGTVKAGLERTRAGLTSRYQGASRVEILQGRAFEAAEQFQLQPPCQLPGLRSTFSPATYKGGTAAYYELLWPRIHPSDRSGTMPRNALGNYQGVLRFQAHLDAHGSWDQEPSQVEGTSSEAARQLLALMRTLPRWQPATDQGQPVSSTFLVEYSYVMDQVRLLLQPLMKGIPPPIRN